MSLRIQVDQERIVEFCKKYRITRLSFFGSVLGDDFGPESDVDVLVSFAVDARWSLFDLVRMERELEKILGREVDLVERSGVEKSENYIRRRHILKTEETFYVA